MTGELKKKFIDILFEDEVDDEELQDNEVEEVAASTPEVKRSESSILAKDILYRKSGGSAFINLNEEIAKDNTYTPETKKEEYEMSSQISPMFGLIKENKRKAYEPTPEITETQTNKPADSHLDIITSPIYGYGNKEDAQDNNYDVKGIIEEDETQELHHLFDEEEYLNNSYESSSQTNDDNNDEISLFRLFGENR